MEERTHTSHWPQRGQTMAMPSTVSTMRLCDMPAIARDQEYCDEIGPRFFEAHNASRNESPKVRECMRDESCRPKRGSAKVVIDKKATRVPRLERSSCRHTVAAGQSTGSSRHLSRATALRGRDVRGRYSSSRAESATCGYPRR